MKKSDNLILLSLISFAIMITGCSKKNDPVPVAFRNGTINITTKATANSVTGATISEFRINVEAIRFGTIGNDPLLPNTTIQVAPLVGPFNLFLVGGTGATIPSSPLPDATYDRVKFDLVRGVNAPMANISILITGKIGNIPFKMWHDTEPTIQKNLNNLLVKGNVINFSIDFVLDGADLSGATDGDGNGTIEISPKDNDGNNQLADIIALHIQNNLKVTF